MKDFWRLIKFCYCCIQSKVKKIVNGYLVQCKIIEMLCCVPPHPPPPPFFLWPGGGGGGGADKVCIICFVCFSNSQNKLTALLVYYRQNGMTPRVKNSGGRKYNTKALTTEDTERVVQFLLHFAEDQVRVLLGTHVMTVEMSVN